MPMSITDDVVATLRAQLAGNADEHESRWDQLAAPARQQYRALILAAFCQAADARFAPATPAADVIEYVSEVRSRSARGAELLDPGTAERLLLAVYTDEDISDIDPAASYRTEILLLGALTADARLDAPSLDNFLAAARDTADHWLATTPA
jgi:hypothetical protein